MADDPPVDHQPGNQPGTLIDPAAPRFRTGALSHRKPAAFSWEPGPDARRALARALDLRAVASLRFAGEVRPLGQADFTLEAVLQADVTQACIISLAPVPARITETVTRRYLADFTFPEGEEVEMPEDDTAEPLPQVIDVADIAREALMLALPPWPRAPGAALGAVVQAPPGAEPLRDADLHPFAALAKLRGGTDDPA